jgi:DNA-binding CsgD family transcriptional regulator
LTPCPRPYCGGWLIPSEEGGLKCALCARHFGPQDNRNGEYAAMMAEAPDTPPTTALGRFEDERYKRLCKAGTKALMKWQEEKRKERDRQHIEDWLLADAAARRIGVKLETLIAHKGRDGAAMNKAKREVVAELACLGLAAPRIAYALHRNRNTVYKMLERIRRDGGRF